MIASIGVSWAATSLNLSRVRRVPPRLDRVCRVGAGGSSPMGLWAVAHDDVASRRPHHDRGPRGGRPHRPVRVMPPEPRPGQGGPVTEELVVEEAVAVAPGHDRLEIIATLLLA